MGFISANGPITLSLGVAPKLFFMVLSALASISNCTISTLQKNAAVCKAVAPSLFLMERFALASISALTIAVLPKVAAEIKGVEPLIWSYLLISVPASICCLTMSSLSDSIAV